MNAREAAVEIGKRFGAEDFALDDEGHAAFGTGEGLHVELHASPDDTVLYAMVPLGALSHEKRAAAVFELLAANAEASAPDTPYFSLHHQTSEIMLNEALVLRALSADSVFERLQSLLSFAAQERVRLGAASLCTV